MSWQLDEISQYTFVEFMRINYGINLYSAKQVYEGTNLHYELRTLQGKLFLTCFPNRQAVYVRKIRAVMTEVGAAGINVGRIMPPRIEGAVPMLRGMPTLLKTYESGIADQRRFPAEYLQTAGALLAAVHGVQPSDELRGLLPRSNPAGERFEENMKTVRGKNAELADRIWASWAAIAHLEERPSTADVLLHGDPFPHQLVYPLRPYMGSMVLLDWEDAAIGPAWRDLGGLLSASRSTERVSFSQAAERHLSMAIKRFARLRQR